MKAPSLILLFGLLIHSALAVSIAGEFQTVQLHSDKTDDYSGIVFGPVEQKDTLWKIAKDYRNSANFVGQRPHSLYPVMYGVYLLNPQAFKDNNVNHLLNDTMLEMPTASFISRIDQVEAEAKIEGDESLWAELQANKNRGALTDETTSLEDPSRGQITTQQLAVLDELKNQYDASLETIQVLLNENERLAEQLEDVTNRVEALSGQVNGDLQAQIDALGALQAQIQNSIQQEPPKEEQAQQVPSVIEQISDFIAKPFVLIAIISLLVLVTLIGLGLWLFKRNNPKENNDLERLNEVKDEPLSELDEIFDSPVEEELTQNMTTHNDIDELPELPDLDGWLNEDSDVDVIDELENSDFDEILSSLEPDIATDVDALSNLPTDSKSPIETDVGSGAGDHENDTESSNEKTVSEAIKDEFDDLKFSVDAPDYIDVDSLLDELDDEPLQSEPELNILQNIADKLPDPNSSEMQDSDAMGKLDLARAYIEIDEFSDAKALLREVIKLGTDSESEEAKQLLQQLNEL
jgi:pilus assembly protein FimV